jgi:hypothetical protein
MFFLSFCVLMEESGYGSRSRRPQNIRIGIKNNTALSLLRERFITILRENLDNMYLNLLLNPRFNKPRTCSNVS